MKPSRAAAPAFLLFAAGAASAAPFDSFGSHALAGRAAPELNLPVGGRTLALSESDISSVRGAEAAFQNPAGLNAMQRASAFFDHDPNVIGTHSNAVAYGHRFGPEWILGLFARDHRYGDIVRTDASGQSAGSFSPRSNVTGVAFAAPLDLEDSSRKRVYFGAAVKRFSSKIDGTTAVLYTGDAGIQTRRFFSKNRSIGTGLAVRNIGGHLEFEGGQESSPFIASAGGDLQFGRQQWHFAAHFSKTNDPHVSLGGEISFGAPETGSFALRGGLQTRDFDDVPGASGLSAGFGFGLRGLKFDYAYLPYGDLGTRHRATVGLDIPFTRGELRRWRKRSPLEEIRETFTPERQRRDYLKFKKPEKKKPLQQQIEEMLIPD